MDYFEKIIEEFKNLNEVYGILLAGSRTNNTVDTMSDYDVYIYINKDIPVEKRKIIYEKYCSYIEIDNKFWETEDDGVLKNGIEIEIIYRNIDFIKENLDSIVINHNSWIGYTTCFWHNFVSSKILYDKTGEIKKLQEKYDIEYPEELKENIIAKNYPLLKKQLPSYYNQIKKAIKRKDKVSINHRIAAFLESYFDIIFAINKIKHYGEKKIMNILIKESTILPENFQKNVDKLIDSIPLCDKITLEIIDEIIVELDKILKN
ncbi:MAG: hypothetical protein PWP46_2196 [Fusobacteriaceae bacterium]|jgi:predicted nucleotidyltransferase|nr:hypothetical protein [Fusobacteriaceae bacterium]